MILYMVVFLLLLTGLVIWLPGELMVHVPDITITLMNFTTINITETSFSANWNLSIRVPGDLTLSYLCLQGEFQASLLYKNITIATSPPKSYNNLSPQRPQLLRVSGVVSKEDGMIGKNIMNDIKENNEVRFGLQLFLPDCREDTNGTMKYFCDGVKFESSFQNIITTAVGNPTCHYDG